MLKVNVEKLGNIAVLSLQGQIVHGETAVLRNAIQSLSPADAVKLDLAGVSMIDAGGLGALLELREHAELNSIRFQLMNVNNRIARVFQITRLDTVFDITQKVNYLPQVSRRPSPLLASCA